MIEPTIIPFNSSETIVVYGTTYKEKYGNVPKVTVYYWDTLEGRYMESQFQPIRMEVSQVFPTPIVEKITVDHGGPQIGLLKIA